MDSAASAERSSSFRPTPPCGFGVVLVVDGSDEGRAALSARLVEMGLVVAAAASGEEALSRARACAPDLVLIDVLLPDMCGLDVARELRACDETREATLVAVAAFAAERYRALAEDAGCAFTIEKPVGPRTLEELVRRALQGKLDGRSASAPV